VRVNENHLVQDDYRRSNEQQESTRTRFAMVEFKQVAELIGEL